MDEAVTRFAGCHRNGGIKLIKKILVACIRLLPLGKIILFESHPDFSDNSFALYEELIRRGINRRYKIYWMKTFHDGKRYELPPNVHTFENDARTPGQMIRRAYVLNCSRYIIDCNSFIYKRRKKQVRIHLGHGMPIKIDLEYSRKFGECDKYMIQSAFWKKIYEEKLYVPEHVLCDLGYPRNDVLVNRRPAGKWEDSVSGFQKVILWMPTYRQHRLHMEKAMENPYPYGMPCVHDKQELDRLGTVLEEENILILFRPHPVQELSVFEKEHFPNIVIADDEYLQASELTLYELLGHTDGLITDYSSVYFDYLLTDRPIALTIEDREEYFQHFTLAFPDYKEYIKGFYVEEMDELLQFIRETASGTDSARQERMEAKRMFHTDTDGRSAVKIADMLVKEYGL